MTTHVKFSFSQDFGPAAHQNKMKALETRIEDLEQELPLAQLRGYENGKQDASVVALAQLNETLSGLKAHAETILKALDTARAQLEADAVELARVSASALAQHALALHPVESLRGVFSSCLNLLRRNAHLALRVAPDLVEPVEAAMKDIAWQQGFDGRVIVLGDPEIGRADCRLEWADGGFDVREASTQAKITQCIETYFNQKTLNASTEDSHD